MTQNSLVLELHTWRFVIQKIYILCILRQPKHERGRWEKDIMNEQLRMNKVLNIHVQKYLRLYKLQLKKYLAHLVSRQFLRVFEVDTDDHLQPIYLFTSLVVYLYLLQDSYRATPMSHTSTQRWKYSIQGEDRATDHWWLVGPTQGHLQASAGPFILRLFHLGSMFVLPPRGLVSDFSMSSV